MPSEQKERRLLWDGITAGRTGREGPCCHRHHLRPQGDGEQQSIHGGEGLTVARALPSERLLWTNELLGKYSSPPGKGRAAASVRQPRLSASAGPGQAVRRPRLPTSAGPGAPRLEKPPFSVRCFLHWTPEPGPSAMWKGCRGERRRCQR